MIRFLTWLRKEPLVFFGFALFAAPFFGLQVVFAIQREGQANMVSLPLLFAAGVVALGALVAIVLRIKNAEALRELREASRFDDEEDADGQE